MEKRQPTYDLAAVKAAFSAADRLPLTGAALRSATALGFRREDIVELIQSMERRQFYKSMTSYRDHRIWQDVYHVPDAFGPLYVKFSVDKSGALVLLSFKELTDD